ncbi:MAG: toast rack family protein [Omnitrophica WOR_2 bacterium]
MIRKPVFIVFLVIALATMACGINIDLPVTVKTGPLQTETISVPKPSDASSVADITLAFGAGELNLSSGASDGLVSGTASFNITDFKPKVTIESNHIRIEQGNLNIQGIPNFKEGVKNTWDLKLSDSPTNLRINAGAYTGDYELGGLALEDLEISDGASNVNLSFSEQNKAQMSTFRYNTGASSVKLNHLGNANFDTMFFRGGAGTYTLDFSGDLKRNADITIDSGISTVNVIIPEGVGARVTFEGGLTSVNTHGAWQKSGNVYSQAGSGPSITIRVNMAAGTLDLSNQ